VSAVEMLNNTITDVLHAVEYSCNCGNTGNEKYTRRYTKNSQNLLPATNRNKIPRLSNP